MSLFEAGASNGRLAEPVGEVRRVDGVEAPICSLADLVALKRIADRERDRLDLRDLQAAHGELPDSREGLPG